MARKRKSDESLILLAIPDRRAIKDLGNALHARGYNVKAALDGSKALEKAILTGPRLILFDEKCPLIPPQKFIQILRSNPRTEDIPIVVMAEDERADAMALGYREALIQKPFNTDELLSLVSATLRKMVAARQVRAEDRQAEGSLEQISLFDLLQIFQMNQKTGRLDVEGAHGSATIYVHQGRVVHASLGRHKGEKALFRALGWRTGKFAFFPEAVTEDVNIRRPTDMLLLEAARQSDELDELRRQLPDDSVRLALTADVRRKFEGLHPVTRQILELSEFYDTVGALVDHSRVTDYEACSAIRTLLEKGVLKVVGRQDRQQQKPLLGYERLYELKVLVAQSMPVPERVARGRIVVVCRGKELRRILLGELRQLPGLELEREFEALEQGLGKFATLVLTENLVLDLVLLPEDNDFRPLWPVLGVHSLGAVVVFGRQEEAGRWRAATAAQQLEMLLDVPVEIVELGEQKDDDGGNGGRLRQSLVGLLETVLERSGKKSVA